MNKARGAAGVFMIAAKLCWLLNEKGLNCRLKRAAGGSCYIRFKDTRIGQCRIGDHNECNRYGYRWQMRLDIDQYYVDTNKGHKRFFYPPSQAARMVDHISNYSAAICRNNQDATTKSDHS